MNRRNFIKSAAGTTALASTAGCLGLFSTDTNNEPDASTNEPQEDSSTDTNDNDDTDGNDSSSGESSTDTTTTETDTPSESEREEITLTVNNKFEQLNARTNGVNPNYSTNQIAVPLIAKHTGGDELTHIRINFHFNNANGDTLATTHASGVPDKWTEGTEVGASVEVDLDPREVTEVVIEFKKMF